MVHNGTVTAAEVSGFPPFLSFIALLDISLRSVYLKFEVF